MKLVSAALTAALLVLVGCSSPDKAQISQFKTYSDFSPGPKDGLIWFGLVKVSRRESN
jgi:hypothetical protein